jgi:hypothetical protein
MAHSPTRPPPLDPEPLHVDTCSGTEVARLGASTDHDNLPVHAERDAMPDPDHEAYILRLPVEVLTMIVELVVSGPRKFPDNFYGGDERGCTDCGLACCEADARAICLVSCTFRDIAQPILFRVIDICALEDTSLIWQTLSQNIHLRKHCRQFVINETSGPSEKMFSRMKDIFRWSVNVQCVQIRIEMVTGDLCRNLAKTLATHAHQLKHLLLSGKYCHYNWVRIVNIVEFPQLTKLDISCSSPVDWDPNWKGWRTPLALDKQHISPITSLTIRDELDAPECSLSLITLPKALKKFTFERIGPAPEPSTILRTLTTSLLIHERTLKSVDISRVNNASHLFDARLFPNLEYLRLSAWNMEGPLVFTEEYTKVLGPQLKILVWNFNGRQSERWSEFQDFGEDEELWLCGLGTAAADSKLQELRIEFTPMDEEGMLRELYDMGFTYPWDRMDNVRDTVMRKIGVSLTYDEPCVSRETWDWHDRDCDESDCGIIEQEIWFHILNTRLSPI